MPSLCPETTRARQPQTHHLRCGQESSRNEQWSAAVRWVQRAIIIPAYPGQRVPATAARWVVDPPNRVGCEPHTRTCLPGLLWRALRGSQWGSGDAHTPISSVRVVCVMGVMAAGGSTSSTVQVQAGRTTAAGATGSEEAPRCWSGCRTSGSVGGKRQGVECAGGFHRAHRHHRSARRCAAA